MSNENNTKPDSATTDHHGRLDALVMRVAWSMYAGAMRRAGYSEQLIKNGWNEKPAMRAGWENQAADAITEIKRDV